MWERDLAVLIFVKHIRELTIKFIFANNTGISSLSIAGKLLANIPLNRLNENRNQTGLLPEDMINRHDLYSKATASEVSITKCEPLYDLCRSYQSIWHSQS